MAQMETTNEHLNKINKFKSENSTELKTAAQQTTPEYCSR